VRQGIFNRGNISDPQQLINPFSFFGEKHLFQHQKMAFPERNSPITLQNNPTNRTIPTPFLWTSQSLQI
jgi:hypothetical protein